MVRPSFIRGSVGVLSVATSAQSIRLISFFLLSRPSFPYLEKKNSSRREMKNGFLSRRFTMCVDCRIDPTVVELPSLPSE